MKSESRYLWSRVGAYVLAIIALATGAVAACNYDGHVQAAGAVTMFASFLYLILSVMIHD